MKKLSFILISTVAVLFFGACGLDGPDCSLVGEWKVKSVDIQSEMMDKSIIEMAKSISMNMAYTFTADSVTVISNGVKTHVGTYQVEAGTEERLKWNAMGKEGIPYVEDMKILKCSGSEVTLLQRSPVDTTKQAVSNSTFILEKVK